MKKDELVKMEGLFDELFPICRSITGKGSRDSLEILKRFLPLNVQAIPSGKKVFDWTVPKEWVIREAWIKDSQGQTIIDFKNSNLHIVNYSAPVNEVMDLASLKKHIFTIPNLPSAIPYVISYYEERWGFCMTHHQYELLEDDLYHVYIDSEFIDGELNYADVILPGENKKEILISTYICHPSMANNELSGPIVSAFLYDRISKWEHRKFTYRFVFVPETIGSIVYLHEHGEHLKKMVYSGAVLTCLGGLQHELSYKYARSKNAPLNQLINHLVEVEGEKIALRRFTPLGGSDERQYCSPGFNLPVGQFSRMVYGEYEEYHNSLDTKELMSIEALQDSLDKIERILKLQEKCLFYVNTKPYGEPKLDAYDLYPKLNSPDNHQCSDGNKKDNRKQLNQVLALLNYSDGENSLFDVAREFDFSIEELTDVVDLLVRKGLLVEKNDGQGVLASQEYTTNVY